MGVEFGELYKMRGIVTLRLSPFEQKAFAGMLEKGFPNAIRRCIESFLYVVPPLALGLFTYIQMDLLHEQYKRKNPDDYKNDC